MKNSGFLFLAIILLSISIMGFTALPYFSSLFDSPDIGTTYSSLGEQIYLSGRRENGRSISHSGGPHWLGMMGGSCSSCHGEDGKGGFQIMMSDEEAPPITWKALTTEEHNEHGEEEPLYNKRMIERAITKGLGPSGKLLDSAMPRWEMNQTELDAIIDFLKELD